ncbi:hypothetical protein ACLF6K_06830 [Streptomyces xanthophaeus]|uniref:hypothetical protein n=1 Tax=Streptomyces xanthophaeus TaxID=67385 RepID=UPI0039900EBD
MHGAEWCPHGAAPRPQGRRRCARPWVGAADGCRSGRRRRPEVSGSRGPREGLTRHHGARLTLTTRPGESGGTLTAENWPTGDSLRKELGTSFNTTGTWELDQPSAGNRHALLRLYFDPPKPDLPTPDTIDLLSIGIDAKRTFIYADDDPDTCPDFRLQLR